MQPQHFVLYLLPSRPHFAFTMTDDERAVMQKHVEYWMQKMQDGKVVAFGPVMDPKGPYGLGIIAAENEAEIVSFIAGDPANSINKYEFHAMRTVLPSKELH